MSRLEKFLLDDKLNDQKFNAPYKDLMIHKEKYNDRFIYIYTKYYDEYLSDNSYNLSAYLDVKDKTIYNIDYNLEKIISEDTILKKNSFKNIEQEIQNNVNEYVDKYAMENANMLKKQAQEKYNQKDDWRVINYQKNVRELFLSEERPIIKLDRFYSTSKLVNSNEYYNKVIINEYLDDKYNTIKKYGDMIIDDNQEELGLSLHLYDDKNKYLNSIKLNKNNEFRDLYINKKIYDSIKNESAKKLNITINYNGKEHTFKCDYSILKYALINDYRGTSFYGVGYENVSNFIKENTNSPNKWREEFAFSHISSITYGKKELYRNENIKEKKQINKDAR